MRKLILLLLVACKQDQELSKRTDVQGPDDWAKAVVSPPSHECGPLGYLTSAEQTYTITNDGTDNGILTIGSIEMSATSYAGYTVQLPECLLDPSCELKLLHGESTEVTVTLMSLGPEEMPGEMIVKSSDEKNPAIPVPVHGLGVMPKLAIDPPTATYPDTTVGCEVVQPFTLTNVGNDELDLATIEHDGASYSIIERPALPDALMPGESLAITLGFAPTGNGDYPGSLNVTSNDPRGLQTAPLAGIGVVPGTQHVSYTVPFVDKLDLQVFVDQSFSMDDDQTRLAANAAAIASTLSAMEEDVQVMVVTSDDGCSTSGILFPDDPEFVATFQAAALDGPEGLWSEAGLYVSLLAIQQTGEYMCNEGFLREGALLHTIYISDEADSGPVSWVEVLKNMRSIKGAEHLVMASAVVGPLPSGCSTGSNSAAPGHGYTEIALETHGGLVSLCDDWAPQLNIIATSDVTRDTFSVIGVPDELTISVSVGGLRRTGGWHYMSDSNSVVFDLDIPHSGQTVDITYEVPLACP
ncbi:MAG: choice-of-anchor D domain-containing protein [Candidatus Uhrbacteria bacterium]|nr:choice-of-anchor D domain-containing protein [Candidatus Uhrbacteria bacterium]